MFQRWSTGLAGRGIPNAGSLAADRGYCASVGAIAGAVHRVRERPQSQQRRAVPQDRADPGSMYQVSVRVFRFDSQGFDEPDERGGQVTVGYEAESVGDVKAAQP